MYLYPFYIFFISPLGIATAIDLTDDLAIYNVYTKKTFSTCIQYEALKLTATKA